MKHRENQRRDHGPDDRIARPHREMLQQIAAKHHLLGTRLHTDGQHDRHDPDGPFRKRQLGTLWRSHDGDIGDQPHGQIRRAQPRPAQHIAPVQPPAGTEQRAEGPPMHCAHRDPDPGPQANEGQQKDDHRRRGQRAPHDVERPRSQPDRAEYPRRYQHREAEARPEPDRHHHDDSEQHLPPRPPRSGGFDIGVKGAAFGNHAGISRVKRVSSAFETHVICPPCPRAISAAI